MITRFLTISGSTYELDDEVGTWARLSHGAASIMVRTADGPLRGASEVRFGRRVILHGPALVAGDGRIIETTPVIEIDGRRAAGDMELLELADGLDRYNGATEEDPTRVSDLAHAVGDYRLAGLGLDLFLARHPAIDPAAAEAIPTPDLGIRPSA